MIKEKEYYYSFLLRLWRPGNDREPVWRASLENPHTGERLGFASPEALFDYLEALIEKAGESRLACEDSRDEKGR